MSPARKPGQPVQVGLVLTGGGARAAYQVGLLRALARHRPQFRFRILTGVSAGAINACHLASYPGPITEAVDELSRLWLGLEPESVFKVDLLSLARNAARWSASLLSGGSKLAPRTRGLVDTEPLQKFLRQALGANRDGKLTGIRRNLDDNNLDAVAVSTVDYATGRTITWVEGQDAPMWTRPDRESREAELTIAHVMASSALPLLFPAIEIGSRWHGDGGVRMTVPLSPALHLGADRIIAISTRYRSRKRSEDGAPAIRTYPPPAQVAGVLMNAIFLDQLDQDALRLQRFNRMLGELPISRWDGMRPVDLIVLRPSTDLGRLAADFENRLPRAFRFFTRGLGTKETKSPDILSLLMFQRDYVSALIEIGEQDAEARMDELLEIVAGALPAGEPLKPVV